MREGIRAALESARSALGMLEGAKSELEDARPVLMESLTGTTHPKAASVEVDLGQAAEAGPEVVRLIRDGMAKFEDYLGTL